MWISKKILEKNWSCLVRKSNIRAKGAISIGKVIKVMMKKMIKTGSICPIRFRNSSEFILE